MHGRGRCRRSLTVSAIALLALAAGAAPAAGKAKRSLPFKLALPAEGSTATRVMTITLVPRPAGRAAAARQPKIALAVRSLDALPDGIAIAGQLLRDGKRPGRATIAITAIRPRAGGAARAQAAQLTSPITGTVGAGRRFDLGLTGGGTYSVDWLDLEPGPPDACLYPTGPVTESVTYLFSTDPGHLDYADVLDRFQDAVCRGDTAAFEQYIRTGRLDLLPPPSVFMSPFEGDPREGSFFIQRSDAFDEIRITAGPNTAFIRCYSGGRPCEVDSPGTRGNSILFDFTAAPVTDSGELNAQADVNFDMWDLPAVHLSSPGDPGFAGPYTPRRP